MRGKVGGGGWGRGAKGDWSCVRAKTLCSKILTRLGKNAKMKIVEKPKKELPPNFCLFNPLPLLAPQRLLLKL